MLIEVRVRQIAEKQGIRSSYQLQNLLGVKPTVAIRLWRNQVKQFNLKTMLVICDKLNCQPGDLMIFQRNKKNENK